MKPKSEIHPVKPLNLLRYARRLVRMADLVARGVIDFKNFKQSLRPAQVAVLSHQGGMLFCDSDNESMVFSPD